MSKAVAIPDQTTDRLCQATKKAKIHVAIGVNERNREASNAMYARGTQVYVAPTWDRGDFWSATLRHIAKEGGMFDVAGHYARPDVQVRSESGHVTSPLGAVKRTNIKWVIFEQMSNVSC